MSILFRCANGDRSIGLLISRGANLFHSLVVRPVFITTVLLALSLVRGVATNAPFSVQEHDGMPWLVKPNDQRFFSLGVCVVNQGASPQEFTPTNAGYAAFQHYDSSNRWAEATLKRL